VEIVFIFYELTFSFFVTGVKKNDEKTGIAFSSFLIKNTKNCIDTIIQLKNQIH